MLREPFLTRNANNFTYHAPKPGQQEIYETIRAKGKDLADYLVNTLPDGAVRELSEALTCIETAVMHANAGEARHRQSETLTQQKE
jgi:hypothetical protein